MTCPRESEIADALMTARWPEACEHELRAHAASCATCADLVLVATAIACDTPQVTVPASGVVWWRIQRREREKAVRTASRTITILQASSIAGAIALAPTIFSSLSVSAIHVPVWSLPLLLGFAVSLALAPVAVYWAVRGD